MHNVVIDTNIIISAVISPNGNPARILNMALDHDIQVYYSSEILSEYREVLSRVEFDFNLEEQNTVVYGLIKNAIVIEPSVSEIPLPDESDRIFYDVAKESGSILITGNIKHYPIEPIIMTPSGFLELFG